MSDTLNIGLIGSGFMGQAHADAIRRAALLYPNLPKTPVLYAIADQNQAMAEQAAKRFGALHAFGNWREMLQDPN
ncbi:Gfo/Idh/MocA family oxidoreductase, partial [Streptomyces griseofuscus]